MSKKGKKKKKDNAICKCPTPKEQKKTHDDQGQARLD
jgi:hypothetical protein